MTGLYSRVAPRSSASLMRVAMWARPGRSDAEAATIPRDATVPSLASFVKAPGVVHAMLASTGFLFVD